MANGYRFHTKARALGKKTQNSGVLVRGDDLDPQKEYYGVLEYIYELSYVGNRKVYLFKCHWWDVAQDKGYKIDKHGFISVNSEYSLTTDDPFVLASQAEQVFYVKDIVDEKWQVVIKTSPRDLFNMPQQDGDNDSHGDCQVLVHEEVEAYQQLETELNELNDNERENDFEVTLQRHGINPQSIDCGSAEELKRNSNDVEDDEIEDDDIEEDTYVIED